MNMNIIHLKGGASAPIAPPPPVSDPELNPISISASLYAVDRLDTYITTESKISASLHPPAFSIGFSDLLGEHHKDEEDEESLEGHHDGVDVGQSDQLLHFHYQHSKYPC